MSEYPYPYIQKLSDALDLEVGELARRAILTGAEEVTSKTSKPKRVAILREIMDRMDAHPDRDAMLRARMACACKPPSFLKDAKKLLADSPDLPAFVEAVQERRYLGNPLHYESGPDGERITGEFGFRRCVCSKVGAAKQPLTMMWCECCRGHLVWMWTNLLHRPVDVTLSESAITGSPDCLYEVRINQS